MLTEEQYPTSAQPLELLGQKEEYILLLLKHPYFYSISTLWEKRDRWFNVEFVLVSPQYFQ